MQHPDIFLKNARNITSCAAILTEIITIPKIEDVSETFEFKVGLKHVKM